VPAKSPASSWQLGQSHGRPAVVVGGHAGPAVGDGRIGRGAGAVRIVEVVLAAGQERARAVVGVEVGLVPGIDAHPRQVALVLGAEGAEGLAIGALVRRLAVAAPGRLVDAVEADVEGGVGRRSPQPVVELHAARVAGVALGDVVRDDDAQANDACVGPERAGEGGGVAVGDPDRDAAAGLDLLEVVVVTDRDVLLLRGDLHGAAGRGRGKDETDDERGAHPDERHEVPSSTLRAAPPGSQRPVATGSGCDFAAPV
jgi:hypothetical protein